jgi:hypothetical protein
MEADTLEVDWVVSVDSQEFAGCWVDSLVFDGFAGVRANEFAATTTRSPPSRTTGRRAAEVPGHANRLTAAEATHEGFRRAETAASEASQRPSPMLFGGGTAAKRQGEGPRPPERGGPFVSADLLRDDLLDP